MPLERTVEMRKTDSGQEDLQSWRSFERFWRMTGMSIFWIGEVSSIYNTKFFCTWRKMNNSFALLLSLIALGDQDVKVPTKKKFKPITKHTPAKPRPKLTKGQKNKLRHWLLIIEIQNHITFGMSLGEPVFFDQVLFFSVARFLPTSAWPEELKQLLKPEHCNIQI